MFKPKYSITPKLLESIKKITSLITKLNAEKFPRLVLAEFEKSARETSSFASTSIEGNPLPLTEVKKLLKSKPENIRDSEREVLNYNQALEKLNKLTINNNSGLNLKLILDTQKIITQGHLPSFRSGKLRKEPVVVNNPKLRKVVYLPPDYQDVEKLVKELLLYIEENKNKTDPIILAGIFHKQFVVVHPFVDGNGRTTRLLTKVLLAHMGLNTFNLFSFENYYNNNVSKYFEKVGVLGNYYEEVDKIDFTEWLEYFADGIIDELLRVSKELEKSSLSPSTELKPYHIKVVEYIKEHGYITDKKYAEISKRAKATRNLDFNKLIAFGVIQRIGKGKATHYKLA